MRGAVLAFALGLCAMPADAQVTPDTLERAIVDFDGAAATTADCERHMSQITTANGANLLYGAVVCWAVGRDVEGNLLVAAGQSRAVADLTSFEPDDEDARNTGGQLYGAIWFQFGGPGMDEVFRDPSKRSAFFTAYEAWAPVLAPDYDPGWRARARPTREAYAAAIAELRAHRRRQLDDAALTLSDDAYYALHSEFGELQRQHPGGFVEGTPAHARSGELLRLMSERAAALGAFAR